MSEEIDLDSDRPVLYTDISTLIEVDEENMLPELESEDVYKEDDEIKDDDKVKSLSHEEMLINFLGVDGANYFLKPNIDVSIGVVGMGATLQNTTKKRIPCQLNVTLDKLRENNAMRFWEALRENSSLNLQKADDKIPADLKKSFNNFARGAISKNMTPPQRSFVEDNEIKQLAARMKSKKINNVDIKKRMSQLMMNLAKVQENTQSLLMRDKSFLDRNKFCESFQELYLPPIIDESITNNANKQEVKHVSSKQIMKNLDIPVTNEELFVKERKPNWNLRFFTENDSAAVLKEFGSYRNRMESQTNVNCADEKIMSKIIDQTRKWKVKDDELKGNETALKELYQNKKSRNIDETQSKTGSLFDNVNKVDEKPESKKTDTLHPLTLRAVMDYKISKGPTLPLEDDGFRQGAAKLWRPKMALA